MALNVNADFKEAESEARAHLGLNAGNFVPHAGETSVGCLTSRKAAAADVDDGERANATASGNSVASDPQYYYYSSSEEEGDFEDEDGLSEEEGDLEDEL